MNPWVARRARLARALGDRPALIPAGRAAPRNYLANVYRFRASSQFLYLVGQALSGAWLLIADGRSTLFVEPPPPDDALWHGPTPSMGEQAEAIGCPVKSTAKLPAALPPGTLTVPALDAISRAQQATWLGRELVLGRIDEVDGPLADALIELRLIHDAAAIDGLERAAEATIAAHLTARATIAPGVTAWQVWAEMQAEFTRRGMGFAYEPIVTPHGEVLHARSLDAVLRSGDLVLLDVGAETGDGWAGDVTRTWPVGQPLTSTQAELHAVVRKAQLAAIEQVRPGVRYRDVHLTACRALTTGLVELGILRGDVDELVADDVHALFFPHGVGHLIGLDVHDMEDLGDRAGYAKGWQRSDRFGLGYLRLDRLLEPGMAVTVEPGFYQVPAILDDPERTRVAGDRLDRGVLARYADVRGIRIEDDVLVTAGAPRVLTEALPRV